MSNRVSKLMKEMTIEEKIGQLIQLSADFFQNGKAEITGPMKESSNLSETEYYSVGSVLGISGADDVRNIQKEYLKRNRLNIPLIFMADIVHGYKTIFPIPLGLGASFNPEIMKSTSEVAAEESAASGLHVTFAPMVDLVRDPRWGRVMESTGEDAFLNSKMASAAVEGFQGDLPLDEKHIAACLKHFAAYGAPEAGREYNTVDISEWRFREQYLPAYAAAIKSQVMLVMTSFNTLFGVPATGNKHLMQEILRDELSFRGVLISDWDAIGELINHGTAKDLDDAAQKAIEAGVDIDMMSFAYAGFLKKAANLDSKYLSLIDESVERILELKEDLGLFDNPYRGIDKAKETDKEFLQKNKLVALKAAEESIVLAKNKNNILPLSKESKITLVGPVAQTGDLLGSWSWKGDATVTDSLDNIMKSSFAKVAVEKGCDYHANISGDFKNIIEDAKDSDVIVAALGLPSCESGEATSMTNLDFPAEQLELLKELKKLNKPIISVVITGRPLILTKVDELSDAVVIAWFPGSLGAKAITNILDGTVEPTGRIPMSFPRNQGQIPIYYNSYHTGRPLESGEENSENKYLSKYIDSSNTPLYEFGFGLGYTNISVDDIRVEDKEIDKKGSIKVNTKLTNNSDTEGKTVLQCYIHQLVGETVRPIKELKWFKKLAVKANSDEEVQIEIPVSDLAIIHSDLSTHIDKGEYEVMVGLSSSAIVAKETIQIK